MTCPMCDCLICQCGYEAARTKHLHELEELDELRADVERDRREDESVNAPLTDEAMMGGALGDA